MTLQSEPMSAQKRATVYFDSKLHRALKLKAAQSSRSVSDLVNDAVRGQLSDDVDDSRAIKDRKNEAVMDFGDFIESLKRSGKI